MLRHEVRLAGSGSRPGWLNALMSWSPWMVVGAAAGRWSRLVVRRTFVARGWWW